MKKEFRVELPLNARVSVVVEAENEQEAINKALYDFDLQLNPTSEKGYDIEEWDIFKVMLEGNFWYGITYEASAEEIF
jgi:hypothetical protein